VVAPVKTSPEPTERLRGAFPSVTIPSSCVESHDGPGKSIVSGQIAQAVHFHVVYRDTSYRVASLSRAVQEGHSLDEAADFARFVINTVAPLLAINPQAEPLKVDGHLLRHNAQELLSAAQERWRTHDTKPRLQLSELEAINHKLDVLAGHVARMHPVLVPVATVASEKGDGGREAPAVPLTLLNIEQLNTKESQLCEAQRRAG